MAYNMKRDFYEPLRKTLEQIEEQRAERVAKANDLLDRLSDPRQVVNEGRFKDSRLDN
jgi:hypothetical protein